MNADKPNIAQIQKYLNGELDAKAMHQLERQAQDDPFLMDALEGYQNIGRDQTQNLLNVNERFAQKLGQPERRNVILWRVLPIAASVLIAVIAGLLWYPSNREDKKTSKVVLISSIEQKSISQVNKAIENSASGKSLASRQPNHTIAANSVGNYHRSDHKRLMSSHIADRKITGVDSNISIAQALANRAQSLDITPVVNAPNESYKTITGIITDATGHPLAGAKVGLKETAINTVTDANGQFSIQIPNADGMLRVTYSGYNSKQIEINNKDSLKIVLNESVSELAEISVPGYADDKPAGLAHPLLGWKAFKAYIKKNAFMPDGSTGRVKLAFKIAKDGSIIGVRVIRGKSDAMNQKAIALLMDGPEWSSQNDGEELKLKIRFRRLRI